MAPGIDELAEGQTSGQGDEQLIEEYTIEQIPLDQRHGKPNQLFNLWFGGNVQPLALIVGLLATAVFGLNFWGSVLAIIVGSILGSLLMAFHSAQGPKLGVPQLIQSRGQFGNYGSLLPVAIVIAMYMGFLASTLVLAGQAANQLAAPVSVNWWIIIAGVLTLLIVVMGYDTIHRIFKYLTPLFGLSVVLMLIWILGVHGLPSNFTHLGVLSMSGFLTMTSTAAIWQISYAPYVSDYSRYLPVDTKASTTFWATFGGSNMGTIVMMIIGAMVGLLSKDTNTFAVLWNLTGGAGWFIMLMFFLGAIINCAINLYGPMLCILTGGQTFRHDWKPKAKTRIVTSIIFIAVAVYIAIALQTNFLPHLSNFINCLTYVLVPWSVINLVDYYLIQKGKYDVPSFFKKGGGIYGNFNTTSLVVYAIGIIIEIPFMSSTFYTGFVARNYLNFGDITWIVAIVVITPLYYVVAKWQYDKKKPEVPVAA